MKYLIIRSRTIATNITGQLKTSYIYNASSNEDLLKTMVDNCIVTFDHLVTMRDILITLREHKDKIKAHIKNPDNKGKPYMLDHNVPEIKFNPISIHMGSGSCSLLFRTIGAKLTMYQPILSDSQAAGFLPGSYPIGGRNTYSIQSELGTIWADKRRWEYVDYMIGWFQHKIELFNDVK